jgi:CBS domain-containing protein
LLNKVKKMKEYYVRDWRTADPIAVSPNTTIHQAHQIMQKANIRHLPVIARGKLISLITLNDIRRAELELAAVYKNAEIQELVHQFKSVAEIMEDHSLTTTPQAPISEAASLMRKKNYQPYLSSMAIGW